MRVKVSSEARADIEEQVNYYAVERDKRETGLRFRESVLQTARLLATQPHAGKSVAYGKPGLRRWPVEGFEEIGIFYREHKGALRIVRVLHGKRNLRAILRAEEIPPE